MVVCYVNPDGSHVRGCDLHQGEHPWDWCRQIKACLCVCHEYPGSYFCDPCSACGHYNSQGDIQYRDGWRPRAP